MIYFIFVCIKNMYMLESRRSKLVSRDVMLSMIDLFEKEIDERIKLIDVEMNYIQTTECNLYKIDLVAGTVRLIRRESYKYSSNDLER